MVIAITHTHEHYTLNYISHHVVVYICSTCKRIGGYFIIPSEKVTNKKIAKTFLCGCMWHPIIPNGNNVQIRTNEEPMMSLYTYCAFGCHIKQSRKCIGDENVLKKLTS